ncbi:MAG: hypothetical protein AAFQ41_12635 [Cyanobacteria bacterium J06623_7]
MSVENVRFGVENCLVILAQNYLTCLKSSRRINNLCRLAIACGKVR